MGLLVGGLIGGSVGGLSVGGPILDSVGTELKFVVCGVTAIEGRGTGVGEEETAAVDLNGWTERFCVVKGVVVAWI